MRSALSYVPRSGPLQAASPRAAIAYLGSFVVVAFVVSDPIALGACCLGAALAGVLAGAGRAVRMALRAGAVLGLAIIAVNGLVTHRGDTVLARLGDWPLFGRVDVTGEALVAGGIIALRALAAIVAFAVYSACVDPDRVLRMMRPFARRSALSATLASRLLPLAARDASRLREAARLRGPEATPVGGAALARRLLAGSLDRAVDAAATLELRGYGLPVARSRRRRERSRFDRRFYLAALVVALPALITALDGSEAFVAYPALRISSGPETLLASLFVAGGGLATLRRAPRARRDGSAGGVRVG